MGQYIPAPIGDSSPGVAPGGLKGQFLRKASDLDYDTDWEDPEATTPAPAGGVSSVSGTAPIVSSGGATPTISISAATTGAAGSMSAADKTKLDGIAAGAQVNVPTDLGYTASTRLLESSTGADVTLPLMSTSAAGLVPASGGGTTNFLRADGTFAAPPSSGGGNSAADVLYMNQNLI